MYSSQFPTPGSAETGQARGRAVPMVGVRSSGPAGVPCRPPDETEEATSRGARRPGVPAAEDWGPRVKVDPEAALDDKTTEMRCSACLASARSSPAWRTPHLMSTSSLLRWSPSGRKCQTKQYRRLWRYQRGTGPGESLGSRADLDRRKSHPGRSARSQEPEASMNAKSPSSLQRGSASRRARRRGHPRC